MALTVNIQDKGSALPQELSGLSQNGRAHVQAQVREVIRAETYRVLIGGKYFELSSNMLLAPGDSLTLLAHQDEGGIRWEILNHNPASGSTDAASGGHSAANLLAYVGLEDTLLGREIVRAIQEYQLEATGSRIQGYLDVQSASGALQLLDASEQADVMAFLDKQGLLGRGMADAVARLVSVDFATSSPAALHLAQTAVEGGWGDSIQTLLNEISVLLKGPVTDEGWFGQVAAKLIALQAALENAAGAALENDLMRAIDQAIERLQAAINKQGQASNPQAGSTARALSMLDAQVDVQALLQAVEALPESLRAQGLEELQVFERTITETLDLGRLGELHQQTARLLDQLALVRMVNMPNMQTGARDGVFLELPGLGNAPGSVGRLRVFREFTSQKTADAHKPDNRILFLLDMDRLGEVLGDFKVFGKNVQGRFRVTNKEVRDWMASQVDELVAALSKIGYAGRIDVRVRRMGDVMLPELAFDPASATGAAGNAALDVTA